MQELAAESRPGLFINISDCTEDRVFERFFLPIVKNTVYENKEAKASQGGTTENERKYSILGCHADVCTDFQTGPLRVLIQTRRIYQGKIKRRSPAGL
jgi:hypothetical protein